MLRTTGPEAPTPLSAEDFKLRWLVLCVAFCASAQAGEPDPRAIFAPLPLPPGGVTRSASGIPGPGYWQNRADYTIAAKIDAATHVLSADETITYTNNSPDALDVLWVQLDQNIYRHDARASVQAAIPAARMLRVHRWRCDRQHRHRHTGRTARSMPVKFLVSDTRMQVRLPASLAAKWRAGEAAYRLSLYCARRVGRANGGDAVLTNGDIYEIAQWFPRMAVYDDLRGWDTAPYLGIRILSGIRRHRLQRDRAVGLSWPARASCSIRRCRC